MFRLRTAGSGGAPRAERILVGFLGLAIAGILAGPLGPFGSWTAGFAAGAAILALLFVLAGPAVARWAWKARPVMGTMAVLAAVPLLGPEWIPSWREARIRLNEAAAIGVMREVGQAENARAGLSLMMVAAASMPAFPGNPGMPSAERATAIVGVLADSSFLELRARARRRGYDLQAVRLPDGTLTRVDAVPRRPGRTGRRHFTMAVSPLWVRTFFREYSPGYPQIHWHPSRPATDADPIL